MTDPIDDRQKSDRGLGGRFALGNKASPGRPPGRGPVAEMRVALATDLDKIIDTLKAQALAGDAQTIRIILDRVLPALRPVDLATRLVLAADGTLADQARAVVQAAADGELAAAQAAQIVTALGGVAKIIETTELVARIAALEARTATSRESHERIDSTPPRDAGTAERPALSVVLSLLDRTATPPTPPPRCTHWPRRTLADGLLELNIIKGMRA